MKTERPIEESLLTGITQGAWKQGYTLLTEGTRRWNKDQIAKNDQYEKLMVFTNFHEEDKGRSRKLICRCENQEDAKLIAAAPRLAKENEDLKAENKRLIENMQNAILVGVEFGYKQCEKGNNLEMAFINYDNITNPK